MYRMKHGNGMNNGWWEKIEGECQSMMQVILVGEMCYSSSVCRCTIQFNQSSLLGFSEGLLILRFENDKIVAIEVQF